MRQKKLCLMIVGLTCVVLFFSWTPQPQSLSSSEISEWLQVMLKGRGLAGNTLNVFVFEKETGTCNHSTELCLKIEYYPQKSMYGEIKDGYTASYDILNFQSYVYYNVKYADLDPYAIEYTDDYIILRTTNQQKVIKSEGEWLGMSFSKQYSQLRLDINSDYYRNLLYRSDSPKSDIDLSRIHEAFKDIILSNGGKKSTTPWLSQEEMLKEKQESLEEIKSRY